MEKENQLSRLVLSGAYRVHSALGPGLLESVYEICLAKELRGMGLKVDIQHPLGVCYRGEMIDKGFRVDLLIEDTLVVEIKSVDQLNNVHLAQILTYLKLGGFKLGLLLNFNVAQMKNGIRRVILDQKA